MDSKPKILKVTQPDYNLVQAFLKTHPTKNLANEIRMSRELVRQCSHQRLPGETLFTILNGKALEVALTLKDDLLSDIVPGIDGDDMMYRIILALSSLLYNQTDDKGAVDLNGSTDYILSVIGEKPSSCAVIKRSAKELICECKRPVIAFKISQLASLVFGRKAGYKDRKRVEQFLVSINGKNACFYQGQRAIFNPLLAGMWRISPDSLVNQEKEIWIVELDGIFALDIKTNYATFRADIMANLIGHQKSIMFRLLLVLTELKSYKKSDRILNKTISRNSLLARICSAKRYDTHPRDREKDFEDALITMAKLKLIPPIFKINGDYDKEKSGYYETNEKGEIIGHFRLLPG